MKITGIIVSWILVEYLILTTADDPCKYHAILPDSKYRGTACPSIAGRDLCDKYIEPQWYRVEGDAELITEKAELFSCATTYPIWMPEPLPYNDREINVTVCINLGYPGGCKEELNIKIKHCSSYHVYYLQPPRACPVSYCFGLNKTCPQFEPCDQYYHETIRSLDLTTFCGRKNAGWYALKTTDKIPTKCPLNSGKSIWLNGSASVPGQIFDAKICFQDGESCCDSYANVNVKNCSGSLVFNISGAENCFVSDSTFWSTWNAGRKDVSNFSINILMGISWLIFGILQLSIY